MVQKLYSHQDWSKWKFHLDEDEEEEEEEEEVRLGGGMAVV